MHPLVWSYLALCLGQLPSEAKSYFVGPIAFNVPKNAGLLASLILIVFLMVLPFGTTAELDPYVSHPPNIPKLHNEYERYDFPAGSGSKVHLTLTNRYVNPISNVSLKADIYELWIPENVQPIAEVQDPPWIERVTSASQNTSLDITFDIRKLEHNQTWTGEYIRAFDLRLFINLIMVIPEIILLGGALGR